MGPAAKARDVPIKRTVRESIVTSVTDDTATRTHVAYRDVFHERAVRESDLTEVIESTTTVVFRDVVDERTVSEG